MVKFTLQSSAAGVLDWCAVTVPLEVIKQHGKELDFVSADGVRSPAFFHADKGSAGASYRVFALFPAEIVQGKFEAAQTAAHEQLDQLEPHPSVLAILTDGGCQPRFYEDVITKESRVEESPAEIVERFVSTHQDWVVTVWRRIRHLHPVVDYGIRWSRRFKSGPLPQLVLPHVQSAAIELTSRFEDVSLIEGANCCIVSPNFNGDDRSAPTVWLRATYPQVSEESEFEIRLRNTIEHFAPIGLCREFRCWDSNFRVQGKVRFGVLGLLPRVTNETCADVAKTSSEDFYTSNSIYVRRIGAQALSANQAGTQRFGAAAGACLNLQFTPFEAYAHLRQMAADEELRPIHYYEDPNEDDYGGPITAANHMKLRTHNRRIDWRNTKDRLGFETEPNRISQYSRRTTDDEQHVDDLAIDAFLTVFDCPGLFATRIAMLQLDALDTQMLSGTVNSAARGVGRPLLSFASAAYLLPPPFSTLAQSLVMLTVGGLAQRWEGQAVRNGRPVRPVATLTGVASWLLTNPDTGDAMRAAAPYEHATVAVGCLAAMHVLPKGMEEHTLAKGLLSAMGETLLAWRYQNEDGEAEWPFIIACLDGDDAGCPLPKKWKTVGTPEFSSTHVVGGSWTLWTLPGILAYAALPTILATLPDDVLDSLSYYIEDSASALAERYLAIDPYLLK